MPWFESKGPGLNGSEQVLIDRHKPQLMLYKEALEKGLHKNVDKVYIYSTSLEKEIEIKE